MLVLNKILGLRLNLVEVEWVQAIRNIFLVVIVFVLDLVENWVEAIWDIIGVIFVFVLQEVL